MNDIDLLRCTELTKTDFHNDNQTDNFNLNINMFQIETYVLSQNKTAVIKSKTFTLQYRLQLLLVKLWTGALAAITAN